MNKIVYSNHAMERINTRLNSAGIRIDMDKIASRLTAMNLPMRKVYIELARLPHVRSCNDTSRGDCLIAVVESGIIKTVLLTMHNTTGEYRNRIKAG